MLSKYWRDILYTAPELFPLYDSYKHMPFTLISNTTHEPLHAMENSFIHVISKKTIKKQKRKMRWVASTFFRLGHLIFHLYTWSVFYHSDISSAKHLHSYVLHMTSASQDPLCLSLVKNYAQSFIKQGSYFLRIFFLIVVKLWWSQTYRNLQCTPKRLFVELSDQ